MKNYSHSHQLATLSLLSRSKSQLFILVLTTSRIFWNLPPWAFSADGGGKKKDISQKRSTHVCDFQEERRKPGLGSLPGFMPLLTPTMCSWLGRFASDLSLPALREKNRKRKLFLTFFAYGRRRNPREARPPQRHNSRVKTFPISAFLNHMIKAATFTSSLFVAQVTCGHLNGSRIHSAALLNGERPAN